MEWKREGGRLWGEEGAESLVFLSKVIDSQFLAFVHRSRSKQRKKKGKRKKMKKKNPSWVPGGRRRRPRRREVRDGGVQKGKRFKSVLASLSVFFP